MKILSPHRRRMEAKRRFGTKEFQNKIRKAQGYKRTFDPRTGSKLDHALHFLRLDSRLVQAGLFALAAAFIYFFGISDYFRIAEISVAGAQQVSSGQVRETVRDGISGRWLFVPKDHLALVSKSRVESLLVESLPLVKEVKSYKRVWPNKIEVEIEERRPGFALNVDGRNYLVDDEGLVVRELPDAAGLLQVFNQVSEPVVAGERLNNAKLVGFILSASRAWPGKINTGIKEAKVPGKAATQIQFVSQEGWGVFLDISRPAETQLSNLSLILNRQIPAASRLKLAYIDLRFEKSAYYCYKDAPCESRPQPDPNAPTNPDGTPVPPGATPASSQPTAATPKQ